VGSVTIRVRGIDDSGNIENPGASVAVIVDTRTCPCTIWSPSATPALTETDTNPWELGVRFTSDVGGFITALRYYKSVGLPAGTRIGHLWSSTGTMLAEATFTETASGWQEVTLSTPVAITANTVYVASYHTDVGRFGRTAREHRRYDAQLGRIDADHHDATSSIDTGQLPAWINAERNAMIGNASLWTLTFFRRLALCTKIPTDRTRRSLNSDHATRPAVR